MKVGMKPIILTNKNNENLLYVSTEFRHLIKNKPTQTGRAWQLGKNAYKNVHMYVELINIR